MKIISHRGNINGSELNRENKPWAIDECLFYGFDVEVDVWYIDNKFYLGHDIPQYLINSSWLIDNSKFLWCHAKNTEALFELFKLKVHCFWHETDKITITNQGIPWCYPNTFIENGITVCLGVDKINTNIYGICTDYPVEWKKKINNFCIDT